MANLGYYVFEQGHYVFKAGLPPSLQALRIPGARKVAAGKSERADAAPNRFTHLLAAPTPRTVPASPEVAAESRTLAAARAILAAGAKAKGEAPPKMAHDGPNDRRHAPATRSAAAMAASIIAAGAKARGEAPDDDDDEVEILDADEDSDAKRQAQRIIEAARKAGQF